MKARTLDGKTVAARIRKTMTEEVAALTARHGRAPGLAVILVGEALRADIVDAPPDETAGTAASPGMAATVGAASGMAVGTGASEVSGHAPARTTAVVLQRGQAMPPFARITCPVTQDASGPARKAATPAMSSGCPSRPSGVIRA